MTVIRVGWLEADTEACTVLDVDDQRWLPVTAVSNSWLCGWPEEGACERYPHRHPDRDHSSYGFDCEFSLENGLVAVLLADHDRRSDTWQVNMWLHLGHTDERGIKLRWVDQPQGLVEAQPDCDGYYEAGCYHAEIEHDPEDADDVRGTLRLWSSLRLVRSTCEPLM